MFLRLGLGQVARHRELAARNTSYAAMLAEPPIAFEELPTDTTRLRGRRVTIRGRFRYDLEQVRAARQREGSPGVHIVTPLERDGTDTLVAITRGWVYAADAATIKLERWREADTVELSGWVLPLPVEGLAAPADLRLPLRAMSRATLRGRIAAPFSAAQVVMTSDSAERSDSVPRRVAPIELDSGPHRSYAILWFALALLAAGGGVQFFRRWLVTDRSAS